MRRYRRVQLISPPSNRTVEGQQKWARWPQPLGLLSMATHVSRTLPDVALEILDFDCVLDLDDPSHAQRIGDAELVGLSVTFAQVDRGFEIARLAKERGADVVIGGNIATALNERIMRFHDYVDYCVCYDGEETLLELARGTDLRDVPNLVWRDGAGIVTNRAKATDLREMPIPDRSFLDFEAYVARASDPDFRPLPDFSRPTNMYSLKGCSWRARDEGGCYFCSIHDRGLRARRPQDVWEERRQLRDRYGVNFIWDPSDNFVADRAWFQEFHRLRPRDTLVPFGNYIRIDAVNDETARMLREVGTVQVFMGLESGSNSALAAHNKGITRERAEEALRILEKQRITAVLGLVIGAVGETQESVIETMQYMKYLLERHPNLDRFEWGTLAPLPGSKAFTAMMTHPELREKYRDFGKGNIMSSLEQMVEDWPAHMCDEGVDFDYFLYIQQLAQEHLPYQMTRYQKRAWSGTAHKVYQGDVLVHRDETEGGGAPA
jgi:radical SAM superfamily enzyme YgiQ (UPF0313 family)